MNEYSEIRVGVDWDNKGAVSFEGQDSVYMNDIPNCIDYAGHVESASVGTLWRRLPQWNPQHLFGHPGPAGQVQWVWSPSSATGLASWFVGASVGVQPAQTYTFVVWYHTENISDSNFIWQVVLWNGTTYSASTSAVANTGVSNGIWRRLKIQFTTAADTTHVAIQCAKTGGSASSNVYMIVHGFMVVNLPSAQTPNEWMVNSDYTRAKYDNVSQHLLSADYFHGKHSWDTAMFDEGTITFELNNESRLYSPENPDSPLYMHLAPRRRIWVQRRTRLPGAAEDAWLLDWAGWTESFEITPGRFNNKRTTVTGVQGLQNLEKVVVTPKIYTNITTGQALYYALENGFEYPTGSTYAMVDRARVDAAFVPDPQTFIYNYLSGQTLEHVGMYWEDGATALETIKDIVDLENNNVALNKAGVIVFQPANAFLAYTPVEYDYGDFAEHSYKYGAELWTALRTKPHYQTFTPVSPPNRFQIADPVTVTIPANTSLNVFTPLTYNNEYSANGKSYGAQGDQTISAVRTSDNSVVTSGPIGFGASVQIGWVGGLYDARSSVYAHTIAYFVRNTNAFEVRVTITTLGYGWQTTYNEDTLAVFDAAAMEYGYLERRNENQYLQNSVLYAVYTQNKLMRYAVPHGWFDTSTGYVHDATTSNMLLMDVLGGVWRIPEEYQTNVIDKDMVIIGIGVSWTPQTYKFTWYNQPEF